MKRIFSTSLIIFFIFIRVTVISQINQGGLPYSFMNPGITKAEIPVTTMPAIDQIRLMSEDSINDHLKDVPWRFGENLYVDLDLDNSGITEQLPGGGKLWRLGILCKNAYSINLTFDNYLLPPGANLYVYNADKTEVIGAFTDKNNQPDRVFATTLVPGEEVIIEYYEPAAVEFPGKLHLYRVTHGYRDAFGYAKSFGNSGSCNNNVVCPEAAGWESQVKSVCMLVSGGGGFCSGVLVNNTNQDGTPYILTANHCYSDPSSWVFWFNWQSPTCTNPSTSPPYNSISGAVLKAKNSASDFCLVQMNSTPPSVYGVYYAGWNRENLAATSGAGIHHPSGDIKKISFSTSPFTSDTYSGTPADSHWKVIWSEGVTEGGSSGSPIFDQNHRVVGQLHGGPSSCSAIDLWDFYGKFSMSWDYGTTSSTRLKDWLDPTSTSGNTLNGWDPNSYAPVVATNPATSVTATSATLNGTVNPNSYVTNYHFEWGTTTSYGNSTPTTSAGSGTLPVAVSFPLTGLTTGITYHFRIVGVSSQGTTNGFDLTFIPGAASITTTPASSITTTSAVSGGNITTDGGVSITARGVCWSTSANPTITGPNHTNDGTGTGTFTSNLTGLSPSTLYHIRAYATNALSTTYYGEDLQFTTSCGIIALLPFSEGFEATNSRPLCWTEENSNPAWQFFTGNGGSNPSNAHTGLRNACLKDNTTTTNTNKLITPVFDLTGYSNVQLSFWHTQQAWGSDQDELKIYYKTSSSGSWSIVQSYLSSISVWTQETLSLPGTGSYYQIAFEGNAKYGYGVCIDDIQITGNGGAPSLSVTPLNQNVSASAGATSFTVTSNVSWNVISDQTWCTVTPSGSGNGMITANYNENILLTGRIAVITVSATGLPSQNVTVTQSGATPVLSVTPSNQNVDPPAGATEFSVTSNSSWTATSDVAWCSVSSSGTGNGIITANYLENTSTDLRVASVTVLVSGLSPQIVTVTQAGTEPVLMISPLSREVGPESGTTDFNITSNSSWSASSDVTWCDVTPSGTGSGLLVALYEENPATDQRTANIIVTVQGISPQSVTVVQDGTVSAGGNDKDQFLIYPNPASSKISILTGQNNTQPFEITIRNLFGQIFIHEKYSGQKRYQTELMALPQGSYYITVKTDHQQFSRKLIIVR